MMELYKDFSFEASHILPKHPGKCSQLHGHSWKLRVYVQGVLSSETGLVVDYFDIKKVIQPIIDDLDHKHLGTWDSPIFSNTPECQRFCEKSSVIGLDLFFNPTSENLIIWIADQIGDKLDYAVVIKPRSIGPTTSQLPVYKYKWSKLELNETCTSGCLLTREEYDSIRNGRSNVEKAQ